MNPLKQLGNENHGSDQSVSHKGMTHYLSYFTTFLEKVSRTPAQLSTNKIWYYLTEWLLNIKTHHSKSETNWKCQEFTKVGGPPSSLLKLEPGQAITLSEHPSGPRAELLLGWTVGLWQHSKPTVCLFGFRLNGENHSNGKLRSVFQLPRKHITQTKMSF